MQKQNPLLRIWGWGKDEHGRLIGAVISALIAVVLGMLPYFAAAQVIIGMLAGEKDLSFYLPWLGLGLAGYAARTLLYNMALSVSHKATFSILKNIRQRILEKLPKLPLGTVMDMSSGKMKQIIVDQVDGMETTLAHLFPELTANIAGPLFIVVCLFVLDWRMALLSIVTLPVGMAFMMSVMGSYAKNYEGAVKTTQEMNGTIVEYIGGIEVIKAFNQGKSSYAKFADRVKANASYYYNWMKKSQFGVSMGYSIVPASLVTILPVGWLWYRNGSLPVETFIMVIILSLGIAGPLIAAMNFVDTLATVGTTVASVDELLSAEEQHHGDKEIRIKSKDIELSHVSFGYHEDKNILRDVSLSLPAGRMTALVGPSGSGKSTIAKLIAGFWDVKDGTVSMGGVDEKKIPLEQLYDQVAFVSQDNYLFDESVRENIRMGRLSASDKEVEEAAKAAGCDAFIRSLEKGYETNVGGGGAHLSGGERQRIAIARAMLKDAPIVIERLTPDGVFGNQTKAKCPALPDTAGRLSADVVESATYLVKYALCCNGYEVDATTPDWSTAVETAIKDFQRDLKLEVTGIVNADTWMSLLLSKGNPDRACTACDTRFEITDERADELKRKGYRIVGRYLTGSKKSLQVPKPEDDQSKEPELELILRKGLAVFPIFQESTTDITYFTKERGKTDAYTAVNAARKYKMPESTVIYFAVDLDATSPQITKYILPYFESLSQNIDPAYKVGIYGTRNVCTQICDAGYAVTCFVSDMSTGYSGNMGFKMPSQWNFDQYAEIKMGNGDWAIDKDAYSDKFEPVKFQYKQPPKPSTEDLTTITEILPLIEKLERVYVEWYTPLVEASNGVLMPLTPVSLATGITNFLRSRAYTSWQWMIVLLSDIDQGFVNYVKENYASLYASLEPYMVKEQDEDSDVAAQMISDEHGGKVDFKHLAATAEGYFGSLTAPIPKSWFGWGADLATTVDEIEKRVSDYDGDYQKAADCIVIGDSNNFPYEDFCADADAIKISEIIRESTSTTHSFSESLKKYYDNYTTSRCNFILNDLKCQPYLTPIKTEVTDITKNALLQVLKGNIFAREALDACCNSFANYIYFGLK